MFFIHLKGTKKAVYMVRCNLMGYGLPEIVDEKGDDDSYIMYCTLETKHDALPNQHSFGAEKEVFDGNIMDLSDVSMEDILSGALEYKYSHLELDKINGGKTLNVIRNIPSARIQKGRKSNGKIRKALMRASSHSK